MIKKIRRIIKKILIMLVCFFVVYYTYITISTHHIMKDIKKIEAGYEINNPAYDRFKPSEDRTVTSKVVRYFTWCWGDKGTIWFTCIDTTNFSDGEVSEGREFAKLIIEKKNGQWEAVRVEGEP